MSTTATRTQPASSRPSLLLAGLEPTRTLAHFLHAQLNRHAGRPLTRGLPDGNGRPVVVAPGLGCNHITTNLLCSELRQHGFLARDWGGGVNVGPGTDNIEAWLAPMVHRIEQLHKETGRKVALVGWSLGGIAAREASRLRDLPVDQVVTLGTPFADVEATNVGWAYQLLNGEPNWAGPEVRALLAKEPPVRGASIYSKADGLVHWEACVQARAVRTRNIEVAGAGHFGMVVCPRVLKAVVEELAC